MLKEGEVAAQGAGHAEVTGIDAGKKMGLDPTGTAASRGICQGCWDYMKSLGVDALSKLKKNVVPQGGRQKDAMFPEDQVKLAISKLSRRKQFACALMVIERMLPSLIVFSRDTCFDISPCMKARDSAWSVLEGHNDVSVMASLGEDLMRNAPDTEDFSHPLTSSALNVFLALSDVIDFCMGGDSTQISNVFTLATDSVYLYLSALEPSVVFSAEEEEKIASHPLMRREIGLQRDDIEFLSGLPDQSDADLVTPLRARSLIQLSSLQR